MHAWVAAEKEVARLSKVVPVASNKLTPQWQLKVSAYLLFSSLVVNIYFRTNSGKLLQVRCHPSSPQTEAVARRPDNTILENLFLLPFYGRCMLSDTFGLKLLLFYFLKVTSCEQAKRNSVMKMGMPVLKLRSTSGSA
jgi:hypothetical protein